MSWDDKLISRGGHFYQSSFWARFEEAQGRQVIRQETDDWMWQAVVRVGRGGVRYLYAPYGPTVLKPETLVSAVESLIQAGREQKAMFVKVEPWIDPRLPSTDYRLPSGWLHVADMQPAYYLTLDLTPSEEELRSNISQSNRNLINQAENRGLRFRVRNDNADLQTFLQLQAQTAKRGGFVTHPDIYYQRLMQSVPAKICHLYFCEKSGVNGQRSNVISAAICYDFGGIRYYAHAASDFELNREYKGAVALLWWLIANAKGKGLKTFDYGGVAPPDEPNHPWVGHTRFKQSFGGQTHQTAGTWDYPLQATKYKLYRAAKKLLPL